MLVCQKLYLNHFQIVTTLTFLSKKHVKKENQEINHTSRTADKKMNNKLMEVLGLYPEMCQVGPRGRPSCQTMAKY